MKLTISLAQIDIALGDPGTNLALARDWVAEAARRGSDLVLFPELWSTGYDLERAPELSASMPGGLAAEMAALAAGHHIWLAGSILALNDHGRPANTALLFDSGGGLVAVYRKIHLFGLMDEDRYLAAGEAMTLVETPWGSAGLGICYDLRFPEFFRTYALAGARLVLLPSEWPTPRLAHWRTLLRARAIENQMYMIAANRVGRDRANEFGGHSAIIDPRGEIVVEGGKGQVLLTATIDVDAVAEVREHIPVFRDRRPELYQQSQTPKPARTK
ncbi:MAG: carbon-nitrogen family hydrolase [Anaerolineae bacterium]